MAKTDTPPFPQQPRAKTAICTAAATIADSNPANVVELCTIGPEGAVMTKLTAIPRGNVSSTNLLLFLQKNGSANKELVDSVTMPAGTVSTSSSVRPTSFGYSELATMRLEVGDKLWVGAMIALAAGIVFKAEFTDY